MLVPPHCKSHKITPPQSGVYIPCDDKNKKSLDWGSGGGGGWGGPRGGGGMLD